MKESLAWRLIAVLAIIEAGAYLGNESGRYFWDLTAYVQALDTDFPYRFEEPYPFIYPPFALDLFTLARSHLFELMSIAQVAAAAFLLAAFADLRLYRGHEWLFAVTAMGGLGVVSLLSGNVGTAMNLSVLALACQAAVGRPLSARLLPLAIGFGALIKPQFALYLGLLLCVERSPIAASAKMLAVSVSVAAIHALYAVFRPADWSEYLAAIVKRTVVGKDFGWGPAGFVRHFTESNAAGLAAYVVGLVVVALLAFATWRRSTRGTQSVPRLALVSLVFIVLTFANPRMPLYDLYASAVALAICASLANRASTMSWALLLALVVGLPSWLIANFARVPTNYPWWLRDLQIAHLAGIAILLVTLARVGLASSPARALSPNLT